MYVWSILLVYAMSVQYYLHTNKTVLHTLFHFVLWRATSTGFMRLHCDNFHPGPCNVQLRCVRVFVWMGGASRRIRAAELAIPCISTATWTSGPGLETTHPAYNWPTLRPSSPRTNSFHLLPEPFLHDAAPSGWCKFKIEWNWLTWCGRWSFLNSGAEKVLSAAAGLPLSLTLPEEGGLVGKFGLPAALV